MPNSKTDVRRCPVWRRRSVVVAVCGALGAATLRAQPAAAGTPLHLVHTGDLGAQASIDATLGGQASRWIVDSGSTIALVSPALALRVGARTIDRRRVATAGGVLTVERVELPALVVAGRRLAATQALVLDLAQTLGEVGAAVDGLVGAPALRDQVTRFDFVVREWRLGAASAVAGNAAVWPLRWDDGLPVVDLALGARAPAPFLLDTGNAGGLVVFERHARTLGAIDTLPSVKMQELGGTVEAHQALLARLAAPGFEARDVPVAFEAGARARRGAHFDRLAGSVGLALFMPGALTIDPLGARVVVEQPGLPTPEPLPGGFGFALRSAAGRPPALSALFERGPAAREGLRPGAVLTAIDGRDVSAASASTVWQSLHGVASARFVFDGREVTLARERFFARWT
jgi:Aspartyl protease